AHVAMLGAGSVGGGFVSRTVTYAAGSQLRDVTRQHMPGSAYGRPTPGPGQGTATDSRQGARLGAESVLAASRVALTPAGTASAAGVAALGSGGARGPSAAQAGTPTFGNGTASAASNGSTARTGLLGRVRDAARPNGYSPPPLAGGGAKIAAGGGLQ